MIDIQFTAVVVVRIISNSYYYLHEFSQLELSSRFFFFLLVQRQLIAVLVSSAVDLLKSIIHFFKHNALYTQNHTLWCIFLLVGERHLSLCLSSSLVNNLGRRLLIWFSKLLRSFENILIIVPQKLNFAFIRFFTRFTYLTFVFCTSIILRSWENYCTTFFARHFYLAVEFCFTK